MTDRHDKATGRARLPRYLHALAACCLAAPVVVALSSCSSKPVVETVTTDSGRRSTIPAATPVVYAHPLPTPDRDVETAGDAIAEATVHLNKRQSAAALRALLKARAAATRALDQRTQHNIPGEALIATLRELDSAERNIQRGALPDARLQLISINRQLDKIK